MSLFGGKKIISVSSTVYNLAGNERDRPQFMQTLMMRNVLSHTKDSMGDTIRNGYLNGPAIRLRQFYRWARKPGHYNLVGMPTGSIANSHDLTPSSLEAYIPHPTNTEVWCQHAIIGIADASYWADEWIMEHRPADLNSAWVMDYNSTTKKITIRFADTSTVVFTPAGFVPGAQYVYAYFIIVTGSGNNATIKFGPDQLYIYRIGSGNPPIDALVRNRGSFGEFFPFIPVRAYSMFLSSSFLPDAYDQTTLAYKKSTGGQIDELIDSIKTNPQVGDIDFAHVMFGVSLNVVEQACKRYLYFFFEKLQYAQFGGPNAYNDWLTLTAEQKNSYIAWRNWRARQNMGGHDNGGDPGPEPPRPTMSQADKNTIRITGQGPYNVYLNYDMHIQWLYIDGGRGNGRGRSGAKKNDCWIVYLGTDTVAREYYTASGLDGMEATYTAGKFRIYLQHQETFDQGATIYFYTYLDVVGAQHKNLIYEGKAVETLAVQAFSDAKESPFIIPLHYDTWKDVRIIDSSQMATACVFVVFNAYEVKKVPWWQSGFFRILLVIVIAIVSVVFTGGAGIGLLGAHLSVGAALGFSGLTAAIVGSVVNALAALVLMTIIEKVAGLFGVFGPIIAAILGIFIGGMISSFSMGGTFAFDWNSLLRPDTLIKMTSAVGGTVQQMMRAEMVDMQKDSLAINKQVDENLQKVNQAYIDQFGYSGIKIDPLAVVNATDAEMTESADTFLARTRLTGGDVANMAQDIIYNFADYSLKLPDAFT